MSAVRPSMALLLLAGVSLAGCGQRNSVGENLLDWQVRAEVEAEKIAAELRAFNEPEDPRGWGTNYPQLKKKAEEAAASGQVAASSAEADQAANRPRGPAPIYVIPQEEQPAAPLPAPFAQPQSQAAPAAAPTPAPAPAAQDAR